MRVWFFFHFCRCCQKFFIMQHNSSSDGRKIPQMLSWLQKLTSEADLRRGRWILPLTAYISSNATLQISGVRGERQKWPLKWRLKWRHIMHAPVSLSMGNFNTTSLRYCVKLDIIVPKPPPSQSSLCKTSTCGTLTVAGCLDEQWPKPAPPPCQLTCGSLTGLLKDWNVW